MTDEELIEEMARLIDPSSWAVMDHALDYVKRKYAGQTIGWPADQYKHKESMKKARAILTLIHAARIAGEPFKEAP